ncbi:TetR/AcrR family transcriptional regulator (plasmid) [Agrobacterium larrymoorei]|uniref:TetR/AcrR family transcriptional regulator n=3 Tax=Agrobacterium larrymoorei TaxID=160699 RepID=A0A4D7E093_9HYPH|nr:TetR/AcrR family transcriptional regulator [Agrobacterium larrymoorei]QYA10658.1 TetR/AcrR family transcriptional regulator [Agrobacterium larrymoorei]
MVRRKRGDKSTLEGELYETILMKSSYGFGLHGFDGTTMSKLSCEAGVSKGSLYNLFQNKRTLFHQCFLYRIKIENDEIFSASKSTSAPWSLETCLRLHLRLFSEKGSSFDLLQVSGSLPACAFEQTFYEDRLLPAVEHCRSLLDSFDGAADSIKSTEAVSTTLILSTLGLCLWSKVTGSGQFVDFPNSVLSATGCGSN